LHLQLHRQSTPSIGACLCVVILMVILLASLLATMVADQSLQILKFQTLPDGIWTNAPVAWGADASPGDVITSCPL
jgi:hypothetical protein